MTTRSENIKRASLKQFVNTRTNFTGRFAEFGLAYDSITRGYSRTILVREIKSESGELVADHAWIHPEMINIPEYINGELISFNAGVERVISGYKEKKRKVGKRHRLIAGYVFKDVKVVC